MASMTTMAKTVIVNDTKQVLSMRVGNHRHFADLATVQQGATYTMDVDFNGTYREFQFTGVEGLDRGDRNRSQNRCNHEKLIVSSDECCDYSCITVKEVDNSGKLGVQKEPRKKPSSSSSSSSSPQDILARDAIPSKQKKSLLTSIWSWTTFWR